MNDFVRYEVSEAIRQWASWKRSYVSFESYAQEIEIWKKISGVCRVHRLLEIGSGAGWFLLTAVVVGFSEEAVGLDPAVPEAGTTAEEISETESLLRRVKINDRVRLRRGTFQGVLRESAQDEYDLLVFRNALHHIYPRFSNRKSDKYTSKCINDLTSLRRLLKFPGHIYVSEVSPTFCLFGTIHNLLRTLRGAPTINWASKRTSHQWKEILEKAGFECVGLTHLPLHLPWLATHRIAGLTRALSHSFLLAGRVR